jgi:crotonobetainyl-CoA:carnitine CoA-transferase CaiB-like acyl-CoA transferase
VSGPLDGCRVLDLSQMVSGPLATMILADQGAEVIKVEPVGTGDVFRTAGPSVNGLTPLFANNNRGKRSLAVDLRTDAGRDIVLRLLDRADVFVQNFRPGVVDRMGLGVDQALARNPGLIYVSISGYGPHGPYRDRRANDAVIQGVAGYVAIQRNPEIPFTDLVRNIVADKATAWTVAQAVTAALYARARGVAQGQHVQVAMLDAALAFLWPDGMVAHTLLDDPLGTQRLSVAETLNVTRCGDGELIYYVVSDDEAQGLFRALGHPEWGEDERFGSRAGRSDPANRARLGEMVAAESGRWNAADLLQRMVDEEVPCGPVNSLAEAINDPQVRHNRSIWEWDHPHAGRVRQARPAARLSTTPQAPRPAIPLLGEHTDEILTELGVDSDGIARLRAEGVLR